MARGRKRASGTMNPVVARTKGSLGSLIAFVVWLAGVLVALAVGFGMVDGVLAVRFIPSVVTQFAGWVVVILTVLGVILKVVEATGK